MPSKSGAAWIAKFPTSTKVEDLKDPFRRNFKLFLKAMKASGIKVTITTTLRPKERAYLMHYSWLIWRDQIDPAKVPSMPGVAIMWNHSEALKGAKEMVEGYGISGLNVAPALNSRHIEGRAVDTVLIWSRDIVILDQTGQKVHIIGGPRNAAHPKLIEVAETYGVVHFKPVAADKVHWSDDGH